MKLNDFFISNYLKASDLDGKDMVVTIKSIESEEFEKVKPVAYFEENKPLILNLTNAKTIAKLYGENMEDWIGKRIQLFSTEVDFRGNQTLAVRVRLKKPDKLVVEEEVVPF